MDPDPPVLLKPHQDLDLDLLRPVVQLAAQGGQKLVERGWGLGV